MTDLLRNQLKPGDFEILEYFSADDLRQRLLQNGNSKMIATKVIHGFLMGGRENRSVRLVAEMSNSELHRQGWTGPKIFQIASEAILGLLQDGWR